MQREVKPDTYAVERQGRLQDVDAELVCHDGTAIVPVFVGANPGLARTGETKVGLLSFS